MAGSQARIARATETSKLGGRVGDEKILTGKGIIGKKKNMEKKWLEYRKLENMKKMKLKLTNHQHWEEIREILAKDKVWQVQQSMFKERKKMVEALEKALNHKNMATLNNQKKVMASFIIDFGETKYLQG